MMKNKKLAIAIPTYNRMDILKENLLYMMEDIKQYNIPLYISDDSTNNDTELMIAELHEEYEYIYYYKNIPSLGHDENCFATLHLPKEEYIWYIGDSLMIEKGALHLILELIQHNEYDFIVANRHNENFNLSSRFFSNAKEVFSKLAWHLTLTGATVYKREIVDQLNKGTVYKNFPQTSIILNSICDTCNLYYEEQARVFPAKNRVSYWQNNIFEVFAKDWFIFIASLPEFYTREEKKKAIRSHSLYTGIFSIGPMIEYKRLGYFNIKKFIKYYRYINASSQENIILIFLIAIMPITLLDFLRKGRKKMRNYMRVKIKSNQI